MVLSLILVDLSDVDVSVRTLLVDFHNMVFPLLYNNRSDIPDVTLLGLVLDLLRDLRVANEDFLLQELLRERNSLHVAHRHVDEL